MEIRDAYRSPTSRAPRLFRLTASAATQLALLGGGALLALSLVLYVTTGGVLVVTFAALGPAAAYLFGGAPRLLEVHDDRVVLRSWLRPTVTLPASGLMVQQMPDELVLVHQRATYGVAAEHFPGQSFAACAGALREVAREFIEKVPRAQGAP